MIKWTQFVKEVKEKTWKAIQNHDPNVAAIYKQALAFSSNEEEFNLEFDESMEKLKKRLLQPSYPGSTDNRHMLYDVIKMFIMENINPCYLLDSLFRPHRKMPPICLKDAKIVLSGNGHPDEKLVLAIMDIGKS